MDIDTAIQQAEDGNINQEVVRLLLDEIYSLRQSEITEVATNVIQILSNIYDTHEHVRTMEIPANFTNEVPTQIIFCYSGITGEILSLTVAAFDGDGAVIKAPHWEKEGSGMLELLLGDDGDRSVFTTVGTIDQVYDALGLFVQMEIDAQSDDDTDTSDD